jgi:hypothetical protein
LCIKVVEGSGVSGIEGGAEGSIGTRGADSSIGTI